MVNFPLKLKSMKISKRVVSVVTTTATWKMTAPPCQVKQPNRRLFSGTRGKCRTQSMSVFRLLTDKSVLILKQVLSSVPELNAKKLEQLSLHLVTLLLTRHRGSKCASPITVPASTFVQLLNNIFDSVTDMDFTLNGEMRVAVHCSVRTVSCTNSVDPRAQRRVKIRHSNATMSALTAATAQKVLCFTMGNVSRILNVHVSLTARRLNQASKFRKTATLAPA